MSRILSWKKQSSLPMRWLYDGGHAGIRFREIGKDSIEELWVKGELSDLLEEKYKFFGNKRVPRLWRENAMSGFVNMAADKLRGMDDFITETRMPPPPDIPTTT
jgi:hypothetical protein